MTKAEAKKVLIKDLITAGISVVVAAIIIGVMVGSTGGGVLSAIFVGIVCGFYCAGLPFGWKWISKVVTAIGWLAILIKIFVAIALGLIAFPVTIIIDIVRYCKAVD